MSVKPFRICEKSSCQNLTKDRFCDEHKGELEKILQRRREISDRRRGSSNSRGYTYKWSKARAAYLNTNRFCVDCLRSKYLHVPATVVDHIVPHKGDQNLFWDRANWQSLCKPCHDAKTAKEDGGFGRNCRKI